MMDIFSLFFVFRALLPNSKIIIRHYSELYEYLEYEIFNWVVHTNITRYTVYQLQH